MKRRLSLSVSQEEAFALRQVLNYYSDQMDGVARAVSLHFAGKLWRGLKKADPEGLGKEV